MVCPHSGMLLSRTEVPAHARTQMNLENLTLTEGSQSQKTTHSLVYPRDMF